MDNRFPPITELLPHRGRAVLLDAVLENTEDRIRASAHITSNHPFFVAGHGVPAWVGIELMAQAAAAHAGMESRRLRHPPRKGLLLGTRRYQMQSGYFPDGAQLEIIAEREFGGSNGVGACACRIVSQSQILASATIIIIEISEDMMP
jgi:predicted hotdog family 3-hydroxylacyl-ACP dehydratase